jgi:hypothetical protein
MKVGKNAVSRLLAERKRMVKAKCGSTFDRHVAVLDDPTSSTAQRDRAAAALLPYFHSQSTEIEITDTRTGCRQVIVTESAIRPIPTK